MFLSNNSFESDNEKNIEEQNIDKLKKVCQMRDKYQSLIVHELRTPTQSISSGTEASLSRL